MIYGYDPAIVVACGGDRRVIRQRRPRTQLPLAEVVNVGGLRLEWFRDRGEGNSVLQVLQAPLSDLFIAAPRSRTQIVSRGFLQEDLPTIMAITDPVADTQHATSWFKVPKSSNVAARLVQDFSYLSSLLDPNRCRPRFPQIHKLIVDVLRCDAIVLADFANWFYQIPITPAWGKFLQGRIAQRRGTFSCVQLRVMSMGLGVSVGIAHTLANVFATSSAEEAALRVCAAAWVDNLYGGGNVEQARSLAKAWEEAARCANAVWSEPPVVYEGECELLGLRFFLGEKRVTATEAMKEKIERNLQRLVGATLRELLGVVGLLLWLNFVVSRCPLAFAEDLLNWLRRVTRDLTALDFKTTLPAAVRDDIIRLSNFAIRASISLEDLTPPATPRLTLFSDAAAHALGAVYQNPDGVLSIRSWPADPTLHIFAKELLAHMFSLELVPRGIRAIGCGIDSTNTLSATRRGHSVNATVNFLLRRYYSYRNKRELHVSQAFIPSERNIADFPSRRLPLPPDSAAYFRSVPQTLPLPFFAVPPWAAQ